MTTPRRGWSKQGARHYGLPAPKFTGACYYCGVTDCTECGEPPRMLLDAEIVRYDDDAEEYE